LSLKTAAETWRGSQQESESSSFDRRYTMKVTTVMLILTGVLAVANADFSNSLAHRKVIPKKFGKISEIPFVFRGQALLR
jgi:hypothetical protein